MTDIIDEVLLSLQDGQTIFRGARVEKLAARALELRAELQQARAQLSALQAAQEWVSVENRLPTEDGFYLVAYYDFYDHAIFGAEHYGQDHGFTDEVTHWHPLPAPPVTQ
jgi:hypothetical protein